MKINDLDDFENDLRRIVPRPAPPGLRERVLGSAFEVCKNAALTSRMRVMAFVFSILIVAVLGTELFMGGRETARLAAFIEGPGFSVPTEPEAGLLWPELAADLGDIDRFQRMGLALCRSWGRPDSRKALLEVRDRRKGMIDHEDPENIF